MELYTNKKTPYMTISYNKISKHPKIFLRLLGVTKEEFDCLADKVALEWQKKVINRYKKPGRNYKLTMQQMLMMLLLYYRAYSTQIQHSNADRIYVGDC